MIIDLSQTKNTTISSGIFDGISTKICVLDSVAYRKCGWGGKLRVSKMWLGGQTESFQNVGGGQR